MIGSFRPEADTQYNASLNGLLITYSGKVVCIWIEVRMMQQDVFWDKRSKKYDEEIKQHDSIYKKTINRTNSLLKDSDVVLDFACASGEMSLDIAPHVLRLHGIDLSGKMIEIANQKALDRKVENIKFSRIDVQDQSLTHKSFSAIVAFNIFHLVDDVSIILNRFYELLEDGGLLVSQTPCLGERGWLVRSLIGLAQRVGMAPPILNLTTSDLESIISGCNFEIVENEMWDDESKIQWLSARKK